MARRHGRNGRLYVDISAAGDGSAEPVAFLNSWELSFARDTVEVTSFDDSNKTFLAGLKDASGSYEGFWDQATTQFWNIVDEEAGTARKFYLYPDRSNDEGIYWFGTAHFDTSLEGGVEDAVSISGDFVAATDVLNVGL